MTERLYANVADNIKRIREDVARELARCNRNESDVTLMAVTKTQPPEIVNQAIEAGITLLGENRAQELIEKHERYALGYEHIHFIGHLQSNKVRQIVDKVAMIQSVDRLSLAQEINRLCEKQGNIMPVLIEVNIGEEETKSGIRPQMLNEFVEQLSNLGHIRVDGLMCIPPICDELAQQEKNFEKMHRHFIDIKAKKLDNICMHVLSMGMSHDYVAAIHQHSNIIRLGRAIFGDRR